MNLHRNARLTPRGRWLLVERVCRRRVLEDRSSAPHRVPMRTSEERVCAIAALRRVRMTAAEISELLGMPVSTVSVVLGRIGLRKRSRLQPLEPPNRYQRERPGELVHIDVKKLGRIERVGHRISGNHASQNAAGTGTQPLGRLGVRTRVCR